MKGLGVKLNHPVEQLKSKKDMTPPKTVNTDKNINFIQVEPLQPIPESEITSTGNDTSLTSKGIVWVEADKTLTRWRDGWICPKCNIGISPDIEVCPICMASRLDISDLTTVEGTTACICEEHPPQGHVV